VQQVDPQNGGDNELDGLVMNDLGEHGSLPGFDAGQLSEQAAQFIGQLHGGSGQDQRLPTSTRLSTPTIVTAR